MVKSLGGSITILEKPKVRRNRKITKKDSKENNDSNLEAKSENETIENTGKNIEENNNSPEEMEEK